MSGEEQLVVPGDRIGVAEEFLPGPWTYELDYQIRAAAVGRVVRDAVNKVATVKPLKVPAMPRSGATVLASIAEIREDFAIARIFSVEGSLLPYPFTGILHVAQVAERAREAKHMHNYVRIGDIVRSRVLNDRPPYVMTIREARLGVVLASCSRCGAVLRPSGDRLKCPQCGSVEPRKLGHGYGRF